MARRRQVRVTATGYIRANAIWYALAFVIFAAGVCTGAAYASAMRDGGAEALTYLESGLANLRVNTPGSNGRVMLASMSANLSSVALIWIAGSSVLGFAGAFLILFIRGFCVGFTVAFLVREMAGAGAVLALSSVLPHNLVAVPALVAACASSVRFSWSVLSRNLLGIEADVAHAFAESSASFFIAAIVLVLAAFVQSYVSPAFLMLAARFG